MAGMKRRLMHSRAGTNHLDEYISGRKHHTYVPYEINNCKLAGSTANISCNVGDSIIDLRGSYLKIAGVAKQTDGTALKTIHISDGFIFGLFEEVKLMFGDIVVESTRHFHLKSMFNAFLFKSRTELENTLAGFVFNKKESSLIDKDGNFEAHIPLNYLFDIANVQDFIYYTRIELSLLRCSDDSNFGYRVDTTTKGSDGTLINVVSTETCKVTLTKIAAVLEHISFDSSFTSKILSSISQNMLQSFKFKKSCLHIYPNILNVTKINIPLKTFSFKSLPSHVVVAFSRMTLNEYKNNFYMLRQNNVEKVTVFLNSVSFPSEPWTVNIDKNANSQMFAQYVKLYQNYRENSNDFDVALSKEDFDSLFPLFVVPINTKLVNPLNNAIDLSIEIESNSQGLVNGSSALFFLLYTENFNFSILQNELINVIE
jgi:hypothetical protein